MKAAQFAPLEPEDAAALLAEVEAFERDWCLVLPYVPERQRGSWLAVLAFAAEVIAVPGRVSNPSLGDVRLAFWRETLDEIFGPLPPRRHPVVEGLKVTLGSAGTGRAELAALIDGIGPFLEPGDDIDIEGAIAVRLGVYRPLAQLLSFLSGEPSVEEGLVLHALTKSRPDPEAVPGEGGVEPPVKRFARALAARPDLRAELASRINAFAHSQKGAALPTTALPLALIRREGDSAVRRTHPLARKLAVFRSALTGRL